MVFYCFSNDKQIEGQMQTDYVEGSLLLEALAQCLSF